MPLFSAGLQQYKEAYKKGEIVVYYKFNKCKYDDITFKEMEIDSILEGNETTVEVEMIVQPQGEQIVSGDYEFI